ncbi:MAG: HEAT repeat domain-containing protein [Candidatus Parabeggiatoa sp.]|nr:HEAT repeat domain-containing protein [Candidatus Parabeggiatoa sp.]
MSRDALIVGINNYSGRYDLTSPTKDAEAIAQLLSQYGHFDTIKRLPDMKAQGDAYARKVSPIKQLTLKELEEALEQLFLPDDPKNAPDMALFFFAGHGWREKSKLQKGYLATSDVDIEKGPFGLSLNDLSQILKESPIKQQVVWLDCCYSGSECFDFEDENPGVSGQGRDRCFIAASREYEPAYQQNDASHGILTAALLKGLDPKLQGRVNNLKLADFVTQELKGTIQKPVYLNTGEIILTPDAEDVEPITPNQAEMNAYLDNILVDAEELDKRYIDLSATSESKTIPPPTKWARDIIPPAFRMLDKQFNPESEKTKSLEAISEALELHECFVLLGAPGAGKSITLKKLQLDSAKLAQDNPDARIPILINLALWHEDIVDLQQFFNIQLQALPFVPLNRALILLDGLNEMPSKKYVQRVPMFEKWLQTHPNLSVIIGCRERHYQQSKKLPLPTVQIAPFDEKRINLFLQAYLGSEAATQLLSELGPLEPEKRSARDLIHLADNPYLLFMLCYVYTQNQEQLPSSRGQLFQMFVQVLYQREQDKGTTEDISYQDFVLGLSEMAFAVQRHRSSTSVHTVWAAKQIPASFSVDALWRLAREASLLNFLRDEQTLQFTHQLILEYLAAEGLLRRFSDLSKYIKKPGFHRNKRGSGAWDEVIYTLVGITDVNPFLVQLAKIDPFLAVDCFEHSPQEVEVTDESRHFITRQLIDLLGSINPQAREAAVLKLVQLGHITLPYLIDLLEKGNKVAKRASLKALAQFDDEPLAFKNVVLALKNSNKWVRKDAQAVLDRIEPSKFESLVQEHDENVVAILEEYGYVGSTEPLPEEDDISFEEIENKDKVRELITRLSTTDDSKLYQSIVESLIQLGSAAVEPLISALSSQNEKLRRRVPTILAKLGDNRAIEPLLEACNDESKGVRDKTKNALTKFAGTQIITVNQIDKLVPYLENKSPNVRKIIRNILGQLDSSQIVDKLIPYLQDKNPAIRASTISVLAQLGDAQIVDKLIPCLQDEHPEVRGTIKNVLVQLGDAQIVDKLIPFLQDKNPSVRVITIKALAQLCDAQIVDKLIPCLQDKAPNVRYSAITAIAKLGDAQIVDKLIPCLQDEAPNVRYSTITALVKLGDAQIVDKLIPCLQDEASDVRGSAIRALAKLGDAQIVDKLIPFLQDEAPYVRGSARKALRNLGYDPDTLLKL